ncbi:MAG: hypothetical protein PHQ72_04110 [Hespellia sp.]|nr:hypothetical protein [Hespellia sp.]
METITTQIQNALDKVDLSSTGISPDMVVKAGISFAVIGLVFALLNCFFGLKMIKIWTAILGLLIGFGVGFGVAAHFGAETMIALAVGAVAGIVLAILGFWLYLAGVFVICWLMSFGTIISFTGTDNMIAVIIAIVAGLVVALVALKFVEPIIIFVTGLQGGFSAGSAICVLASVPGTYTPYIIGVILAILGIVVQFIMESRKKAKLHLAKADKVRAENSTESEVEKLRAALDYTDKVKEDPDADDYYDDDED